MRVLVTGSAGFIGFHLCRLLLDEGATVAGLDGMTPYYDPALKRQRHDLLATRAGFTATEAMLEDAEALGRAMAAARPDVVVHLAAQAGVRYSIEAPRSYVDANLVGTFNLLEAARTVWEDAGRPAAFRFVHVSTDEVFGHLGPEGRFDEGTPYAPRSPYAATKAASDHLARAWGQTWGLPVIVTNCSNNYGPFHFPEKLIPVVILNALHGRPIPVYGKGENVRDWLFVEDHAAALLRVLEGGAPGRSYAIGGEAEARNIDIVRAICAILDRLHPEGAPHARLVAFVADRPGHDLRYAIDPARIRAELGWRPTVTLAEGLERTVAWYLENPGWWRPLLDRAGVGARLGTRGAA